MILDTLDHLDRYADLNPRFAGAFAFLRGVRGHEAPGRHEIDGENVFALVQAYATRPAEGALFEAHRRYIDVQFVHSGRETILWAPLAAMREPTQPYDGAKDAALWPLVPEATPLHLGPGHCAILFPEDAHAPCLEWETPAQVFKVVVKVAAG